MGAIEGTVEAFMVTAGIFTIWYVVADLYWPEIRTLFIKEPVPADDVKVNIMPISEFQQKYGGTFKVSNLATGETLFTTTLPTPDPFNISDMD